MNRWSGDEKREESEENVEANVHETDQYDGFVGYVFEGLVVETGGKSGPNDEE